jgi:endonuclease
MAIYDKPVRFLMRDMADDLARKTDDSFTRQQAEDWFQQKYPKIKKTTVACHLIRLSTNAPSRVHYRPVPKEDDVFFQVDGGHFRRYDPKKDPLPIGDNIVPPIIDDEQTNAGSEFAYEHDLRDYLARNLQLIEPGLELYEEDEIDGVEFPCGGRFIDILAVDPAGDYVVIELKVSRGYDRVVGQLLRYMAWVQQNHADGKKVRGAIVAREISSDLQLASSFLPNVTLYEYSMSVALKKVAAAKEGAVTTSDVFGLSPPLR